MKLTRDKYWYGRLLNMILLRLVSPTVGLIHAEAFAILEAFNGPMWARDVINASWVYFVSEASYLHLAEHSVAC